MADSALSQDNYIVPEKLAEFHAAYDAVEEYVSVLSALRKGICILAQVCLRISFILPISLWSFLPILLTISFVSFLLSFLPLFLVHFWQKVTSNNCESMNAKFPVKVSFDVIPGKCWSDVVPTMLHDTRKHFANARKSVAASSQRLSLREGLSENGLDKVAQNCNVGSLLYSCVDFEITPIASSKPVVDDVEPGHVSTLELNFQKQIVRLARQL